MNDINDISEAIRAVIDDADKELMLEELGENEHVFSPRFEKKLKRKAALFFRNGQYVGEKSFSRSVFVRRAVAIACALLLFVGVAFNAEAIGDLIARWTVTPGEASTHISFEVPEGVEVPETIESKYYLSKIPEGYTLLECNESLFYNTETYINDENNHLVISQYCYHYFNSVLDTEAAEVNEIAVLGNKGYTVKKEASLRVIWENGEYCFVIHSTYGLTAEDLIELASFVVK